MGKLIEEGILKEARIKWPGKWRQKTSFFERVYTKLCVIGPNINKICSNSFIQTITRLAYADNLELLAFIPLELTET